MPKTTALTTQNDAFKTLLRKSGYKATGARLAVLHAFARSRRPLSAQNVIDTLPRIARCGADAATVYRTLVVLKEKGIIKQVDLRHNHAHYELADTAEHHHLICLQCGKIEDVEHCGIEAIQTAAFRSSKHFAEIKQHALDFYGTCKACARTRKSV